MRLRLTERDDNHNNMNDSFEKFHKTAAVIRRRKEEDGEYSPYQ